MGNYYQIYNHSFIGSISRLSEDWIKLLEDGNYIPEI